MFIYSPSYVFTGLGHLMEQVLISNARLLRLPNDYGIKKMMRNMLALQQSIKTLTNDQQNTEFERAKQYYSLYYLTPQVRSLAQLIFNGDPKGLVKLGNAGQDSREAAVYF